MNVIILKTNLATTEMVERLNPILNHHALVSEWHVDLEDIDRVLRIETSEDVSEDYFQSLLTNQGFKIELFTD